MLRSPVFIRLCLGVLLLVNLPRAAAAAGEAVVRGATTLNVRSGPGREHPSFVTLTEGSMVEVQSIEGSWARIRTSAGETGYVHKAFLVAREEEPAPVQEEAPAGEVSDTADVAAAPAGTPSSGETASGSRQTTTVGPDSEVPLPTERVLATQQRLERLVEALRADVNQLLETTRQRGGNLATHETIPTPARGVAAVDATESGSLLGLSIIGLVAGFVLGTIYGRRQERGRRTRVRF